MKDLLKRLIEQDDADDELLEQVDIRALEKLVSDKVGVPIKFESRIEKVHYPYIKIESQDLRDEAGIMAPVYESLVLSNFGGGLTESRKEYVLPVHFSWKYKEGGSNGIKLIRVRWDFAKKAWVSQE